MKAKVWLSRREAAAWLSMSVDSVDRRLVPMSAKEPMEGKFRFQRLNKWDAQQKPIGILAADVYRVLAIPAWMVDPEGEVACG